MLEVVRNFIEKRFLQEELCISGETRIWAALSISAKIHQPQQRRYLRWASYYHGRNCSHALRRLGWRADVPNWDMHEGSQIYYHGEDFRFTKHGEEGYQEQLDFYLKALWKYDIFHFSNIGGMVLVFRFSCPYPRNFIVTSKLKRSDIWARRLFIQIAGASTVYRRRHSVNGRRRRCVPFVYGVPDLMFVAMKRI